MTDIPAVVRELGSVLGVWAHPDDETYLSAGLMAAAVDNGQRVVVVSATAGERGTDDSVAWPPERLGAVRRWEAAAALGALGVRDHRWLGLGDGTLADHDAADGADLVAKIIADVGPDTIVTFGPDGMTGHPDHRTISRWVADAHRLCSSGARILHATSEAEHAARFAASMDRVGVIMEPGLPITTPASEVAVDLRLDDAALDRKLVALRAMPTQTGPVMEAFGPDAYRDWVSQETFVEASAPERV